MAYLSNTTNKPAYHRHRAFARNRSIEHLYDETLHGQARIVQGEMPTIGTTRGTSNAFQKDYSLLDSPVVVSSGAVRLFGGHTDSSGNPDLTGGHYIGVSMRDAAEGDRVGWLVEGRVRLELDAGDAEAGRLAASQDLEGKVAYWLSEEGKLTDIVPNGGVPYLRVGYFSSDREIQPKGIPWGICFAVVDLQPQMQASVPTPSEVAHGIIDPSTSCEIKMFPEVYLHSGLTVDFHANAYTSDPNSGIDSVYWNFTGTQTGGKYDNEKSGQSVSWTFASAGTYTVTAQVNSGTCCKEFQFYVVVTADAAPVIEPCVSTLANAVILNMPRPKVMSNQVLDTTINVQLNHNSIIADNGGATLNVVRVIGESFSETHFDALIDSITWTTSAGTFADTGTTTSNLANPVLVLPKATDAVYNVTLAIDSTAYNAIGSTAAVFGLEVNDGALLSQFVVAGMLADATLATEFDFSNESILVNVTPASYRWRYDLGGVPVTDATETGNHDYTAAAVYSNDYSQEWSGNGAIGTYYSQFVIELI